MSPRIAKLAESLGARPSDRPRPRHAHKSARPRSGSAYAGLLALFLLVALPVLAEAPQNETRPTAYTELHVEGLGCDGCPQRVREALLQVPGVLQVDIRLEDERAALVLDATAVPSQETLIAALERAGFKSESSVGRGYERFVPAREDRPASEAPRAPASGRWEGAILVPESLAVAVDIDLLPNGHWVAEVDIPAHGIRDHPVGIEVSGRDIVLHVRPDASGGTRLVGTVDEDGSRLAGHFAENGQEFPVGLVRRGEPSLDLATVALAVAPADSLRLQLLADDARQLRETFNADAGKTRLVLLLSPT